MMYSANNKYKTSKTSALQLSADFLNKKRMQTTKEPIVSGTTNKSQATVDTEHKSQANVEVVK